MTALIIAAVVLFAVFALFIAWWDLRGWLHDVDLGDFDADVFDGPEPLPHRHNGEAS